MLIKIKEINELKEGRKDTYMRITCKIGHFAYSDDVSFSPL